MTDERERILVNLGTPSAPSEEAVRAFLAEFLADPLVVEWPRWVWLPILRGIVLRRRPARAAERYRSIWRQEGSPLWVASERIARALAAALGGEERASAACRYGDPSLAAALGRAAARAGRVSVTPLFPQRTASSSGTIERATRAAGERLGLGARLGIAPLAPDDPGYVAALAARLGEACREAEEEPEHLVLSFHSIPAAVDRREGGLYRADCERTCVALLAAAGWGRERATLAFQSRFGPARWIGPATAATLRALAARGVRRVAVTTPGFLCDGLESLEEIGVRGRAAFLRAGGRALVLARAPEDHPELIAALARLEEKSGR